MYRTTTRPVSASPPRRARSRLSDWGWRDLSPLRGFRGTAEAASQTSRPLSLTASRHGALLHALGRLGHTPPLLGFPTRTGGKASATGPDSVATSVLWRWKLQERTTSSRGIRMQRICEVRLSAAGGWETMRDRREFHARGYLVHVPPRSKGSSWTGCSPPANRARYAMDVHPGTNVNSLEHVEDHCRELRPNGFLRSWYSPGPIPMSVPG